MMPQTYSGPCAGTVRMLDSDFKSDFGDVFLLIFLRLGLVSLASYPLRCELALQNVRAGFQATDHYLHLI